MQTEFRPEEVLWTGEALSTPPGTPVSGVTEVDEYYAEAVVPLLSNRPWADYLGLELGGRYSDYNHAGDVQTYKAGGEWQPFDAASAGDTERPECGRSSDPRDTRGAPLTDRPGRYRLTAVVDASPGPDRRL